MNKAGILGGIACITIGVMALKITDDNEVISQQKKVINHLANLSKVTLDILEAQCDSPEGLTVPMSRIENLESLQIFIRNDM